MYMVRMNCDLFQKRQRYLEGHRAMEELEKREGE
jgi:hypothetical protein